MVKKATSAAVKTPSKTKSSAKKARAAPAERSPAIEFASLPDETRIRERAYGIWIEEGPASRVRPRALAARLPGTPARGLSEAPRAL
ncbi:MAG: hypothetical protein WAN05_17480 [Roseiarcus sp.]